jgi:copper chaperone CopZ
MNSMLRNAVVLASVGLVPLASACSGGDAVADRPAATEVHATASPAAVPTGLARADFAVERMTCGACAAATRIALEKLDGVEDADASYDDATGKGTAWALYDPAKVTPEEMMEAIRTLGYTPSLTEA